MRPLLTPAQGRIVRAVVLFLSKDGKKSVSGHDDEIAIEAFSSEEWATLTFSGDRHQLTIRWPAAAHDIDLDGAQFHLPGTIVVVERAVWAAVESGSRLTIDLFAITEAKKTPSSA